MDQITLDRIKLLHPKVRQEALEIYSFINNSLLGKGVRLRFAYTLRTNKEQDTLYAQGRTVLVDSSGRRLGKVTNARGGESIHNYGLAFDIVLLLDPDGDGRFDSASWDITRDFDHDSQPDWLEVVQTFKAKGWTWGGDWKKFPDYPHFEKTFGHTWKSLKAKAEAGATFSEEIDGKTYKWIQL